MAEEFESSLIELTDEDGEKTTFEVLLTFDFEDSFYVAMIPKIPDSEFGDDEVLLMRVEEEEDEDVFLPIETEEELEAVWQAFLDIYYAEEDEEE